MTEREDNALVEIVLFEDKSAYRILVERHQARIFYMGLKFLANENDAEDFTQEVFLLAFRKLKSFSGKVPFSAWLYRIAYNHAVNKYRQRIKRVMETEYTDIYEGNQSLPEKKLLKDEVKRYIRKALQKLPDKYNIILKMHFFDGLNYKEISKILGKPINTIKSHVLRAKDILKKEIGNYLGGGR